MNGDDSALGSRTRSPKGSLLWGALIAVVSVIVALAIVNVIADEPSTGAVAGDRTTTARATESSTDSRAYPDRSTTTQATPTSRPTSWQAELASLTVAPEGPREGYDRDLFKHWIDADGDGCDTRCEVLERQRTTSLPGLDAGGWLSIYEGYSTDDPSEFDVDHVVALSEAWDSGAASWDATRREAFANDLDSGQLIAVTAATNRSKSDRDPAEWQPPNRDAWCQWGSAWIEVKATWGLSADQAELDALGNIMRGCD